MSEREWWEPTLTDAAWIERVRKDYPDACNGIADDEIREVYAHGRKYAVTWDHIGDAYDEYEPLADDRAALRAALAEAVGVIRRITENHAARLTERGILVYGKPVANTGFVEALEFLASLDGGKP